MKVNFHWNQCKASGTAQGRGGKEEEPSKLPRFPYCGSWEKQNTGIAPEQVITPVLNGGRGGDREKIFLYFIDFHIFPVFRQFSVWTTEIKPEGGEVLFKVFTIPFFTFFPPQLKQLNMKTNWFLSEILPITQSLTQPVVVFCLAPPGRRTGSRPAASSTPQP